MTCVDRRTRCIVKWRVVETRTGTLVQEMVHESPQAQRYFRDGFEAYQTALYWPANHEPMEDKSETDSVEGDNIVWYSRHCDHCVIILPGWHDDLIVSTVASMRYAEPSSLLSSPSIVASLRFVAFLPILCL